MNLIILLLTPERSGRRCQYQGGNYDSFLKCVDALEFYLQRHSHDTQ
jgi:hypothetical protein